MRTLLMVMVFLGVTALYAGCKDEEQATAISPATQSEMTQETDEPEGGYISEEGNEEDSESMYAPEDAETDAMDLDDDEEEYMEEEEEETSDEEEEDVYKDMEDQTY